MLSEILHSRGCVCLKVARAGHRRGDFYFPSGTLRFGARMLEGRGFQTRKQHMPFKFSAGQAVEYTPRGGKAGWFTVVRQMPEEFKAFDRIYRIKSNQGVEWSANECDLVATENKEEQYGVAARLRNTRKY
jgi:hypothetical protein